MTALLPDGRVLVAGGRTRRSFATDFARAYDPVAAGWTALPPMPVPRFGGFAASLPDGSVLIIGGDDGSNNEPPPIRFVPPG